VTLAKLTILFGESTGVSERLMHECEAHSVRASILLRAAEGFGIKHHLHTERLLTLSEDLPLAVVAIDERAAIVELADRVAPLVPGGLVTVESATPADATIDTESVKLTLLASRQDPVGPLVQRLQRAGMDAVIVLLGLDGTIDGRRRKARFFSRNADVPALVVATGPASAVESLRPGFATVERIVVCKRDGERLADPHVEAPPGWWQRISIHSSEDLQLVRALRLERASGATALHGVYGYSGSTPPHGDRFFALQRTVPILTVVVDRPENVAQWWPTIDELTERAGLVTSELVPDARPIYDSPR
jgi:PII-like signaling protein